MNIDIKHGCGSMDMDIQHGHGDAAWRWTRSIDWSCSMDMVMQHRHDLQYVHEHAAWTWTHRMDLDMQHGLGHAVCPYPCCIDMDK
jgi:hypothetical protein